LGIKEKLPLINSSSKGARIAGYVLYGFVFLIILGNILPGDDKTTVDRDAGNADEGGDSDASAILSSGNFGNYTFDGQEDVKATVKKGTDIYHMMDISEIPDDSGYTKDGAQYTVTSTGKHIKGYIDYTDDGYAVIMKPKSSSLTKNDFKDILDTFHRVD